MQRDKPDIPEKLPTVSSRYEIKKKLGAGGMGVVYEAYDNALGKIIAIKILQCGLSKEAALRFHREAKATAKLDHRNILRVLDFGESDHGDLYLVMEYINGRTLADVIRASGPLPIEIALTVFDQICCGLEHAHSNGVLHRDVKPSNIMLLGEPDDYSVKIVDFGLAKLESTDQKLTSTGEPIGSPLYMSPEQARGHVCDERSDIYSLGAVMFMSLKGEPPLQGQTYLETITKHAEETAPRLNDDLRVPKFPIELEDAVALALKNDPSERCQSVSELRQLLSAVGEDLAEEPQGVSEEQKTTPPAAKRVRHSVVYAVIGLLVFTAISILGFALIPGEEKPKEKPRRSVIADKDIFTKQMAAFDWLIVRGNVHHKKIKRLANYKNKLKLVKIIDPKLDDSDVPYLVDLPIELLDLTGTAISDNGLVMVAKMPNLRVLILNDSGITNAGAELLSTMSKINQLEYIALSGTSVDDNGVAQLSKSLLKGIDISRLKGITPKSLDYLASAKNLSVLRIGDNSIKGSDLKKLATFKNLRHLSVAGLGLNDSDMAYIAPLDLFNLDISNNKDVTDQGLEKVHPYMLGILDVRNCPKISKQEIESIYERRGFVDHDLPRVVSDFGGKEIDWSRPVALGGASFDPEMFWGRAPLDWLDESSLRMRTYIAGRNMIAKENRRPTVELR